MSFSPTQPSPNPRNQAIVATRSELVRRFFPGGIPPLWVPPLTHYDDTGAIDVGRMAAHLRHLAPNVRGLLIPGSTGDGWELSAEEVRRLLELALVQAEQLKLNILIGALRPEPQEALTVIRNALQWLRARQQEPDPLEALIKARVCGFTVCPPRGAELSQRDIANSLAMLLESGVPMALYQLPQVTKNEMSAEVADELARCFPNFVFFKDTSGVDRVALQGRGLEGVFTTRGAEGGYARWLKLAGGPYDGYLLGSANCFASQYRELIDELATGRTEAAQRLAKRLTGAVEAATGLVTGLPHGNAFANANKAMDHFFAYGPLAVEAPPPRLHAGSRLPVEVIRAVGQVLKRYDFMPSKGYLE